MLISPLPRLPNQSQALPESFLPCSYQFSLHKCSRACFLPCPQNQAKPKLNIFHLQWSVMKCNFINNFIWLRNNGWMNWHQLVLVWFFSFTFSPLHNDLLKAYSMWAHIVMFIPVLLHSEIYSPWHSGVYLSCPLFTLHKPLVGIFVFKPPGQTASPVPQAQRQARL